MEIAEFEHGKTRIMAEMSDLLHRRGFGEHSLLFDLHRTHPHPEGATLTVNAGGGTVHEWFSAQEIQDCRERIDQSAVRRKIEAMLAGLTAAVA